MLALKDRLDMTASVGAICFAAPANKESPVSKLHNAARHKVVLPLQPVTSSPIVWQDKVDLCSVR